MAAERLASSWRLAGLLGDGVEISEELDVPVSGLSSDSRTIEAGQVFFARRGNVTDGALHIEDAVRAGAAAVVRAGAPAVSRRADGVVEVCVEDVAAAIGAAADRFYQSPSRALTVIGVTGTNGKTSVAHFVAQAFARIGEAPCGVLGTLGQGLPGALRASALTTPDAIAVHRALAELRAQGARHAVMEVSSHALDQGRVAGVAFDGAVFTNLTRDHLDYHDGMQAYADAKRKLFEVPALRFAVVNADDAFGRRLIAARRAGLRTIAYAASGVDGAHAAPRVEGEVERLEARIDTSGDGIAMDIVMHVGGEFGEGRLRSGLIGRFNAYNLLAAMGALLAIGWPFDRALRALASVEAPAGRLQRFGGGDRPLVVVDYSHTPDSLGRALETLRPICRGRLWCVFGAGGDRDRGKRPMMGAAAAAHADVLVLTDDNPRGEDGDRIIEDIRPGIPEGATVHTERDRAAAIARAIAEAARDDVVLVAGKGHENYQEVAGRRLPFSDAAAVRAALEARPA
ncbi:MAG: UDP-N-acetylmuramoyl-L-alanyl-D-glutamate--2,6-diaminopimelate ligase [Gammaproteobacteria bacterium]|nr:UDP-N-acetylmuramoyl-L-alanyl-D-glutamate--2,6-diaminopimelate ligase [Gammaproteobacteria bacterium]